MIISKTRSYSFYNFFKTFIDLIFTKIFFKNSRLIRSPLFIRNKKNINFGKNLTTGRFCRLETFKNKALEEKIKFGNDVQIGDFVHISAVDSISIGDNTLLASKVLIIDHDHGYYDNSINASNPFSIPIHRELKSKAISIGNNVWIGDNTVISKGSEIGEGSVIGANSFVNSIIPSFSIATGNPAKVIKFYDFDNKIWKKK